MQKIFVLILLVVSFFANAQITINERIDQQLKLDTYEYGEETKLMQLFQNKEPYENILDYKLYIGYVYTHFTDKANKKGGIIDDASEKEVIFETYRNRLKKDTLFVNTLQQISDNSAKAIQDKPVYNFDAILDIAVKFIKITDSNEEGNYALKVCVGVNDLDKTQPKRFADIEAFCFKAIFEAYADENEVLKNEIIGEFHKIISLNMGADKEERILRAQGALIVLMSQNEVLKSVLLREYESLKEILPFAVTIE